MLRFKPTAVRGKWIEVNNLNHLTIDATLITFHSSMLRAKLPCMKKRKDFDQTAPGYHCIILKNKLYYLWGTNFCGFRG
jgi:hypothetical protein